MACRLGIDALFWEDLDISDELYKIGTQFIRFTDNLFGLSEIELLLLLFSDI